MLIFVHSIDSAMSLLNILNINSTNSVQKKNLPSLILSESLGISIGSEGHGNIQSLKMSMYGHKNCEIFYWNDAFHAKGLFTDY